MERNGLSLKIVIASDSFKESMSASSVAAAIERGILKVDKNTEIIKVPLADGGEGTMEALVDSLDGTFITHMVTGPLGEKIQARYGLIEQDTAVMDIAEVVGLHLIPKEKRNPLHTTTYGIGELILHALDQGVSKFIIGLGGSGTNDGGIGMAQALGAEITDKDGKDVPFGGEGLSEVHRISMNQMDERLRACTFDIACDVKNPLTGPKGASYTYGPQKGADPEMVSLLDEGMKNYEEILKRDMQVDVSQIEGAGAAGGLGTACIAILNGKMRPGIELVTEVTNLESHIKDADLVITGEGKIDNQTLYGKTPVGVAAIANKYDVPVIVITGANHVTTSKIYETGIDAIFSITDGPIALAEAMERGEELTEKLAENIMRLYMKIQKHS